MSTEPQPDVRWAPLPPKPKGRWHIWLIVALATLVVAALVVFLVFVLPDSFRPEPGPTASASHSPSPRSSPSATPTATPSPAPTSESTSEPTAPPDDDPSASQFADAVTPWLDDAETGLRYASESGGESAAADIELLQQDAERLSDSTPPAAIADEWAESVTDYIAALDALQSAYRSGDGIIATEEQARGSLQVLREIVGL